jgi:propionyl-CoA synthetase
MTGCAETDRRALGRPEAFWADAAAAMDWERRWERVLDDSRPPFYRWFTGGRLNTCWRAHGADLGQPGHRPDQAIHYRELRDEVARLAGVLACLGVGTGDRVLVYMPMVP